MNILQKKLSELSADFINYVAKLLIEDKITLEDFILQTERKVDFLMCKNNFIDAIP